MEYDVCYSPRFVSLEGNIGAGKTTLCNAFYCLNDTTSNQLFADNKLFDKKHIQSDVFDLSKIFNEFLREPIHLYENFRFFERQHNPLNCLYKDPQTQTGFAQLHFLKQSKEYFSSRFEKSDKVFLTDRSFLSTLLFIKTYKKLGFLSNFTYDYLLDIFLKYQPFTFVPDCFVFLDVPPEVCIERINHRNRESEINLDPETIYCLDSVLHDWFKILKKHGVPVVHIPWQKDQYILETLDEMAKLSNQQCIVDAVFKVDDKLKRREKMDFISKEFIFS